MNDEFPDPLLDAELRDVPLPEGLLARLREAALPEPGEIDDALRSVPLPTDFSLRLRARVEELCVDEMLCDVPVPPDLLAKLHVIPELREPLGGWRVAVAASLMLVVGGLYGLGLTSLLDALRPRAAMAETQPPIDVRPLQLEMVQAIDPVVRLPAAARQPSPYSPPPAKPDGVEVEFVAFDRRIPPGAAGQMRELQATDFKPDDDVYLLRWGALGAPHFGDAPIPDLERVSAPRAPGVDLPLARGYDRVFWLKHGIHPPISPGGHPELATSRVALTNRTDSVELTRRRVAAQRLPDAAEIRIEDFLAFVDYHFPRPQRGRVAIHTAAGPALFGPANHQLLQIGVNVGRAPRRQAATHLTVALDISTSMGAGHRLKIAQEALSRLERYAGPDDRISLIAFHHDMIPLVESLRGDQLSQLASIVASLQATGGDNLAGGLQQAVSGLLAAGLDDHYARNLVVLTDGQSTLPAEAAKMVASLLQDAGAQGITTTFVQIGAFHREPPWLAGSPGLEKVNWTSAQTARDVQWDLVEGLTGASAAVAEDPILDVEFNPAVVEAYRLVGHGTLATSGLGLPAEPTTLHNDEAATALYEVWLAPNRDDNVAWVRARWNDLRTGDPRVSRRHPIYRSEFAGSIGEMPSSLQAAATAAEIGKILSGGYDFELTSTGAFQYRKKARDFRELAAGCKALNPNLSAWKEFQDLLELVDVLANVRRNQSP